MLGKACLCTHFCYTFIRNSLICKQGWPKEQTEGLYLLLP